ncbi:MAG: M56 family metallopeptidase, partial [Gorillibacterium sp.]|nr:M56 family metallopeptidase [Gorillibacterium sp.]
MIKWLLITSLTGSMVNLFLILFKAKLVKQLGGVRYYYVCLFALVLFVLPIQVHVSKLIPQRIVIEERAPIKSSAVIAETFSAPNATTSALVPAAPQAVQYPFSLPTTEQCLMGIWAIGFIFMMSRYLFGYFRFKYKVMQNSPMGKAENLDVVVSDYVFSPMLIGFIHPKIIIPNTKINEDDYKLALIHELNHYKQKDAWFKLFADLINSLHWFNPITYFAVGNISEACEYSCDEKTTKGMEANEKKYYSEMILN